jgi:DNA polymerase III delta prime subunit
VVTDESNDTELERAAQQERDRIDRLWAKVDAWKELSHDPDQLMYWMLEGQERLLNQVAIARNHLAEARAFAGDIQQLRIEGLEAADAALEAVQRQNRHYNDKVNAAERRKLLEQLIWEEGHSYNDAIKIALKRRLEREGVELTEGWLRTQHPKYTFRKKPPA